MPFGGFIDRLPQAWFLVIHATLAVIRGAALAAGPRAAGQASAARGFVLYILGEFCYVVGTTST